MTDTTPDAEQVGTGEYRASRDLGTAVVPRVTGPPKSLTYSNVDGMAIFEGDIALGTVTDVQGALSSARDAALGDHGIAFGVGIVGARYRWPDCVLPYEIDPDLTRPERVTDAIAHWEEHTPFRFPLRTTADADRYPDWVRFSDEGGCWSYVGMQTGRQTISLGPGCSTGNTIHEIGHAVGLWHEQSREDRDMFVTVNWENIEAGRASQFNQHIADGNDLGPYDYASIMHYGRFAFSGNGSETITPTDPDAQIGQRDGLSPGDIASVAQMYPGCGIAGEPQGEWLEAALHVMMG